MKFLFSSWGSRGDLHPFLALGQGLLARGHQVSLVGHPEWQGETEAAGLRFYSTGEPPRENLIRENPDLISPQTGGLVALHALVHKALVPSFEPTLQALLRAAPDHEVIVAHHFSFTAPLAAELAHRPYVTVTLAPGVVPSAYALPGAHYGEAKRGRLARMRHRLIWEVGRQAARRQVDPAVNALRLRYGCAPVQDAMFDAHSKLLNLQLYSRHFALPPPDWSAEKQQGGFCFYDPPANPTLAPEIEEFLAQGKAPVLCTLGSIIIRRPGSFYQEASLALQKLGLRGLLLIGEEGNRPAALPPSILAVPYSSYGALIPRVRAVIHQGGIGTLSHVLRAGKPAVICPFSFDQPNNASRLKALGLAEVLRLNQREAPHLAAALQRLLSGSAPIAAQRMGEILRAEDGVGLSCDLLEKGLGEKGRR